MKYIPILLLFAFIVPTQSQSLQNRNIAWYLPSSDTRINGLGIGLVLNKIERPSQGLITVVNGISIEVIGYGIALPMVGGHPLYTESESESYYFNQKNVDFILAKYNQPNYIVNGISISPGGTFCEEATINGLNISGVGTLVGKMNGLSLSLFINSAGMLNGVSMAIFFNHTIQTNGLQIGLFNESKRLRGIQIGLWNVNEKRSLPFINWNFREKRNKK